MRMKRGAGAHRAWVCCVLAKQEENPDGRARWRFVGAWGPIGELSFDDALAAEMKAGEACARLANDRRPTAAEFNTWHQDRDSASLGLGSAHAQLSLRPPSPMSAAALDALCDAVRERLMKGQLAAGSPWAKELTDREAEQLLGLAGPEQASALTESLGGACLAAKEREALAGETEGAALGIKRAEIRL